MASESGSETCVEPNTNFRITGEALRDAVLSLNNGKGATLKDLSKFFLAKGPSWLTPEDVASQLKVALKKGLQGGLIGTKNKTFTANPADDDDEEAEKGSKKRRRIGRSLITDVDNFVRQLKRQRRSKSSKRAAGGKRRSRKGRAAAKTHGRRRRRSRGRKRRSGARKGRKVRRTSSKRRRGGRKRSRSSKSRR